MLAVQQGGTTAPPPCPLVTHSLDIQRSIFPPPPPLPHTLTSAGVYYVWPRQSLEQQRVLQEGELTQRRVIKAQSALLLDG